jgi:cell division protein FtsX
MRRVLVVLLVLVAVFVGVGFYLDWFNVSTGTRGSGKTSIDLTIDKDKMKSDANQAKEKVQGLGSKSDSPPAGTPK